MSYNSNHFQLTRVYVDSNFVKFVVMGRRRMSFLGVHTADDCLIAILNSVKLWLFLCLFSILDLYWTFVLSQLDAFVDCLSHDVSWVVDFHFISYQGLFVKKLGFELTRDHISCHSAFIFSAFCLWSFKCQVLSSVYATLKIKKQNLFGHQKVKI